MIVFSSLLRRFTGQPWLSVFKKFVSDLIGELEIRLLTTAAHVNSFAI